MSDIIKDVFSCGKHEFSVIWQSSTKAPCPICKLQAELDTLTAMLAKQKAVIPFTKIWDVEEEEIWNKL